MKVILKSERERLYNLNISILNNTPEKYKGMHLIKVHTISCMLRGRAKKVYTFKYMHLECTV